MILLPVRARMADDLVHSMGANIHLSYFRSPYGTLWPLVKAKLVALGIRHLRDSGTVVNNLGWMNVVYGRMTELAQKGMRFNLVMAPEDGSSVFTGVPHFPRLLQHAAAVVENFEGLNEHDVKGGLGWAAEAIAFQQALYKAVKAEPKTKGMPVFGPSMAHAVNAKYLGNLSASLDYGAIHPYPGGGEPLAQVAAHKTQLHPVLLGKRCVVTETGYHTCPGWAGEHAAISEEAMASYVPRIALEYFGMDIPRTYLYEFIDQGVGPDREDHFGLIRADGSEKPAYRTLGNLIALTADKGPAFTPGSLTMALDGGASLRSLLLQRRDGRFLLVLWRAESAYALATRTTLALTPSEVQVAVEPAVEVSRWSLAEQSPATKLPGGKGKAFRVPVSGMPTVLEMRV